MTKSEKLRKIIRADVSSGFMHELEKELNQNTFYVKRLKAHPEFIPQVIDELVEKQLPYYETVSAEAVDAAYLFFMSPAGTEWYQLSAKFVLDINRWIPDFIQDVIKRLANTN